MREWLVGRYQSGLQEYEGRSFLADVRPVQAASENEAIDKWADITGTNKRPDWDPATRRDWGFPILATDNRTFVLPR